MVLLELWQIKVLAAVASAALACIGCALARSLKHSGARSAREDMLQIGGNTLAAGILLSASLTHMLPDAMQALDGVVDYPLAPAIAGVAFCFLVILGEAVGSCMPKREEPHTQTDCAAYGASFALWPRWELVPPHGCEAQVSPPPSPADAAESGLADAGETGTTSDGVRPKSREGSCCGPGPAPQWEVDRCHECGVSSPSSKAPPQPGAAVPLGHSCHSHSSCCRVHRHADAPCSTQDVAPYRPHGLDAPLLAAAGRPGHVHGVVIDAQQPQGMPEAVSRCHVRAVGASSIVEVRSFLVFFALCFHSVMEGLGMGSSEKERLLLPVMLAILAHKGLAAFALGCSLTQSDLPSWRFWAFVSIFASGTPIGCLVGMLSTRMGGVVSKSTASGICIALSSGTFLQVSSMELLPRAFAEERHKLLGSCCLCLGFASMSLLAAWV
mmetsp:Transcript_1014/g.3430  ORF Transcript_1014/g.3430 Transcript_1014/m.3430 type:complete len:440 (+) Transcript_1014:100-1419(+)